MVDRVERVGEPGGQRLHRVYRLVLRSFRCETAYRVMESRKCGRGVAERARRWSVREARSPKVARHSFNR